MCVCVSVCGVSVCGVCLILGRGQPADREDPDTWLLPSRFIKDIPPRLRKIISFDKKAVEARLEEPLKAAAGGGGAFFTPSGGQARRGAPAGRSRGRGRGAFGSGRGGRDVAVTRSLDGREVAKIWGVSGRGNARGSRGGSVGVKGGTAPREKGPFDD